jgi:hypothetical protein
VNVSEYACDWKDEALTGEEHEDGLIEEEESRRGWQCRAVVISPRPTESGEGVEEVKAEDQDRGYPCPRQQWISSGEGDGSMARLYRKCLSNGEEL